MNAPRGTTVSFPGSNIVGTCGNCGGPMMTPKFHSANPNVRITPVCAECGFRAKPVVGSEGAYGKVMEVVK